MTAESTPAVRQGICVIGRTDFQTGIGRVTSAALELLSRYYDVSLYPAREGAKNFPSEIRLPSGRIVPIAKNSDDFAVYFFTDVLWNGIADLNYTALPTGGVRIAHIAYDSDELPPEWVQILNDRFDLALFSSPYLEDVARNSGVRIPVSTLAIGIDLEPLIARRYLPPVRDFTRFGTISAFHDRKGLDVLVEAFLDRYADRSDVELVIHSNLAIGDTYARVEAMASKMRDARIVLSHGYLTESEKNDLMDSFDVYVSASSGEGYSIGPREALALGKPAVLSQIPAHEELDGLPGVFMVKGVGRIPARYPEIDNRVFGMSTLLHSSALGAGLEKARLYLGSTPAESDSYDRKNRAGDFSLTTLAKSYARVVNPDFSKELRSSHFPPVVEQPPSIDELLREQDCYYGMPLGARRMVVPVRDGGFFSIFNIFMTHLTWSLENDKVSMVLPDWDAGRLIERSTEPIMSYCYSQPDGGNMWLDLFEPLYGLSAEQMNDPEFLYGENSFEPYDYFNARREPLLTYINAYELYRAPWFQRFRNQYNSVVNEFVHLKPELRAELDSRITKGFDDRFVVAAHVKHPSHAIEQPGQAIAGVEEYLSEVRRALSTRGIAESSDDWRVFVATDQERVVAKFMEEFGDRVVQFDDVSRVTLDQQDDYDNLDEEEKIKEGYQLQHLMSANTASWSPRLAWEVWRDAEAMAASDVLIHAVSNVATAVSYLGPQVDMVYNDPHEA